MLWDLNALQWLVSFSFVFTCAYIGGWVADRILGTAGFGTIGNWLLLVLGTYAGLYCYNAFGYRLTADPTLTIMVSFGAALFMLFVILSVKAGFRV